LSHIQLTNITLSSQTTFCKYLYHNFITLLGPIMILCLSLLSYFTLGS
jgi:hypothetical protein